MKLYFSPGSCSLSPHIALEESGLPYEVEQVDLKAKKVRADGSDYLAVNPKGYVPALRLDDGELLTEGAIIVQYIADQNPDSRLAPKAGTRERLRLQEWLHFIATELHKGFGPINNPNATDELKTFFRNKLNARFAFLAKGLGDKNYLLGNDFSVADGYAYYTLRSYRRLDQAALEASPVLKAYFERVDSRPKVRAVLEAEGLT